MSTDEHVFVFPWEGFLWSIVVATLLRARHLLNQQRFVRALAEVPLAYFLCMVIINWLLGFESIGPGPVGYDDRPQSIEQSHIEAGDCMREYQSAAELLAAVRRTEVCTLVVLGAKWDGHYKSWVRRGAWSALGSATCADPSIDVGVYHYSGGSDATSNSIPQELGLGPTLGSYSPRAFRAGRDLGELASVRGHSADELTSGRRQVGRDWWMSVEGGEIAQCASAATAAQSAASWSEASH